MSEIAVRAAKMSDEAGILALARQEMTALEKMDPRFRLRPDSEGRYATYLRERSRDTDTRRMMGTTSLLYDSRR